jgi:hypothetical protein
LWRTGKYARCVWKPAAWARRARARSGTRSRRGRCALTALDLSRNFLGAGGAAALAEGLALGATAGAARLATLRLGHNAFGCAGASALAACASASDALERLERLDAQSNGMGPEGIAALARGVLSARGAPRLRELRLQGNPMGAAGARALARASLALPDGDEGEALSPAFATHGSLRVLGLGSAKLGVVGAAAVAWAMRQELGGALRGVSALDLSANDVGESGAALPVSGRDVVRGGFSHDRADVEAGTLGDAGRRTAAEDEDEDEDDDENASNALASLARDLAAAPALRRLDLGYNSLGDAGARVVAACRGVEARAGRARRVRAGPAAQLHRRRGRGGAGARALGRRRRRRRRRRLILGGPAKQRHRRGGPGGASSARRGRSRGVQLHADEVGKAGAGADGAGGAGDPGAGGEGRGRRRGGGGGVRAPSGAYFFFIRRIAATSARRARE